MFFPIRFGFSPIFPSVFHWLSSFCKRLSREEKAPSVDEELLENLQKELSRLQQRHEEVLHSNGHFGSPLGGQKEKPNGGPQVAVGSIVPFTKRFFKVPGIFEPHPLGLALDAIWVSLKPPRQRWSLVGVFCSTGFGWFFGRWLSTFLAHSEWDSSQRFALLPLVMLKEAFKRDWPWIFSMEKNAPRSGCGGCGWRVHLISHSM